MCTNSRCIKAPDKRYRPLEACAYRQVPCCKCAECRNQLKQEWFLRIWAECDTYNKAGGKNVFVTFTYNKAHEPVFRWIDHVTGEYVDIPGFSKHDKDRFFNSMAKWFERRGLTKDSTESGLGLRFVVCCEFASDPRFTQRAHYHVIIHFPPEYVKCLGFKFETQWKRFIEGFWKNGFCIWSTKKKGGIFVTRDFAMRYVSKYMCKDVEFFDQPEVMNFLYPDGKLDINRKKLMTDYLPKHWQSKSYGLGLIDFCKNISVFHDGLSFNFLSDNLLGKKKTYPVPRYIRRKVLYDYDSKTGRFEKNSKYFEYNRYYVIPDLEKAEERLTKYLSIDYLNSKSIESDFYFNFNRLFGEINKTTVFGEDSLRNHLFSLLDGLSLKHVVYYNKFIRGRIIKKRDFSLYSDLLHRLVDLRSDNWFNSCLDLNSQQLFPYPKVEEFSEGYMFSGHFHQELLYFLDNFPEFKKINLFLQQLEYLRHYLSERQDAVFREDSLTRKLVNSMVS